MRTRRIPRGFGQYSPPSYFDEGWANVFVSGCQNIGVDPYGAAQLIIGESGWNPAAQNPSGAAGLNQLASGNYSIFENDGLSLSQYLNLPVSQQLPYVFKYWQEQVSNAGVSTISARDLYWLNWVPALYVPGSPDSYVIQNQGDPYYSADLDIGNKGYITAGDLSTRLANQATNNPNLWAYLESSIDAAGGWMPTTQWLTLGGIAAGFALYYLLKE